MNRPDYSLVTEVAGSQVSEEQLDRIRTRYHFATRFCQNRRVLEAACGSGQGLGLLASVAKEVVGLDIDPKCVALARKTYPSGGSIQIVDGDAQHLSFEDNRFDVIILLEALYYFADPEGFFREAWRLLTPGGLLIIGESNPNRPGFSKSPYSYCYYSAPELLDAFTRHEFDQVKLYGDCPVVSKGFIGQVTTGLQVIASRFGLIPKTMKTRSWLKRIFSGPLVKMPSELTALPASGRMPVAIDALAPDRLHKVLFGVGRCKK